MTIRLMRTPLPSRLLRARHAVTLPGPAATAALHVSSVTGPKPYKNTFAKVNDPELLVGDVWFSSTAPRTVPEGLGGSDHKPPDERTLKLGKTVRVLHERLPTLLASPLPQEILSPQISLHLFPSTHPHLPTVSGRIAYLAALWTAPMAWGRVPVVGNVKLVILSERMHRNGGTTVPRAWRDERLVVKWKTCGKTKGKGMGGLYRGIGGSEQVDKITEFLGGDARDDEEFCGLFIFEFDEEGRIVRHTIEHAEEGGNWDKTTRMVSVTDWLLGKWNGKNKEEDIPGLAWYENPGDNRRQMPGRRGCDV